MKRLVGPLVCADSGQVVASQVEIADTFLTRLAGLQFRKGLAEETGFLIVPCNSVHTACMRFAIDVLFLDQSGTVIAKSTCLKPWRVSAARGAHAVLELPAQTATTIETGTRLRLQQDCNRPSVRFLLPADLAE